MEYQNIDRFIKQKKLLINELIGKKILYKAEKDKAIQEYEIDEIINSPLAYRSALMKLRDCLSHNSQRLWKVVKIADIKFVKIEPEKNKSVAGKDNDIDWMEILKKSQDKNNKFPPQSPLYPPQTLPYKPQSPPWGDKITCSKCGLDCSGTMGYCCPQPYCPMGMGGIQCSTITKDASVKQITNVPPEYSITHPQSQTVPVPPTSHYDDAQYSYH